MKRIWILCLTTLILAVLLCGCGDRPAAEDRPWPETIEYSNLNDPETRETLDRLLASVPFSGQSRSVFFEHVDEINACLKPEELTDGFEKRAIAQTKYDPYELQDRWEQDHPYFPGYNCRITAFSFMNSLMDFQSTPEEGNEDTIFMDLASLEEDSSALPAESQLQNFRTF